MTDDATGSDDDPPLLPGAPPEALGGGGERRFTAGPVLGRGATATVWAVRDEALQRDLAVKVLSAQALAEPDGAARFLDEARLTASIRHPNVLAVLALDRSADGRPCLAMPRVDGTTLAEALAAERHPQLPDAEAAVNVLLGMSAAVASAHAQGVVHQDIKPDNVLLGRFGEVLVLDWGSALRLGPEGRAERGLYGTPVYMSPEQARSAYVDRRSDVWALGAVLFHALVLRPPIRDDGTPAFWERKRRGEIDPPDAGERLAVPAPLLAIALRAMAPDPAARYPDAAAFRQDLLAYQGGQAVAAWPTPWGLRLRRWHGRNGRRLWVALAVAALIVGLTAVVWRERLRELATWDKPLASENFVGDDWRARWLTLDGGWSQEAGAVVSTGPARSLLAWNGLLPPDVAIEFTGRIRPGATPGDLSVYWYEGDRRSDAAHDRRSWLLQLGAFDNLYNAIYGPGGQKARESTPLETGRSYRIRAEIRDNRLALWRDGRLVLQHVEDIPLQAGSIAVLTWYPGKEIRDLRLWVHGVPERVSALAIGDAALADGEWRRAAAWYQRIAATVPALADEARWRAGLSLASGVDQAGAERAWQDIGDPALRRRAELMRCDDRLRGSGWAAALPVVEGLYRTDPALQLGVRQRWSGWLEAAGSDLARRDALVGLRERRFPDDPLSGNAAGFQLLWLCQQRQALARFGDDRLVRVWALMHLGDFAAAQAVSPSAVFIRSQVARCTGEIAPYLAEHPDDAESQCVAGHPEIAAADRPEDPVPQFYLGHLAAIADDAARPYDIRARALRLLGRLDEALALAPEELVVRLADPGSSAWLEAQPAGCIRIRARGELALRALIAGDRAGMQRHLAEIARIEPWLDERETWFAAFALPGLLAAYAGDPRALQTALAGAEAHHHRFGQRWWFLARRIAGACDEREFLAQPIQAEARAWLLVADAIRADLAGRTRDAAGAWAAFLALPPEQRLLDGIGGEPTIEHLARWRCGQR